MPTEPNDTLTRLSRLPLFNLSLGSKELFHSEMLQWLCSEYPALMNLVFAETMPPDAGPIVIAGHGDVRREHRRKDLSIALDDQRRLFVENKVKSIAGMEQLDEYDVDITKWRVAHNKALMKEAKKQKLEPPTLPSDPDPRVLLSLVRPSFVGDGQVVHETASGGKWYVLTYAGLASSLRRAVETGIIKTQYHRDLVADYLELLDGLVALTGEITINWDAETCAFLTGDEYRRFASVRLHDLFYKLKYQQIVERVVSICGKPDSKVVIKPKPEVGCFVVGSGMTNATGLAHFGFLLKEHTDRRKRVVVGVQVQHDEFRLFIETETNRAVKSLATMSEQSQFGEPLVCFDRLVNGSGKGLPKGKDFRRYDNKEKTVRFAFRYERIKPETLVCDVAEAIAAYCNDIVERRDYIERVLAAV